MDIKEVKSGYQESVFYGDERVAWLISEHDRLTTELNERTAEVIVADCTALACSAPVKRAFDRLTSLCANYREALAAVQRFEGVIYGAGGIGAIVLLNKALDADKAALQAEKEGK